MPRFRSRVSGCLCVVSLLVACFCAIAPALAAPPATQGADSDPRLQAALSGMHNAFTSLASVVGGLSAEQQTKADALEKSTGAKLKADPAMLDNRDTFIAGVMNDFRGILTAEQQTKFDVAMEANQKRTASVRSGANLKGIGMAAMVYSFDHDGALPPDLGSLVPEALSPPQLLSGASKTTVPDDLAKKDPKQQKEWATEHTDFIYLAGGKKQADLAAGFVIAYVKPTTPPDRNSFLLSDGSVLAFDAERSAKIVEELKAGKNPPPSMQEK